MSAVIRGSSAGVFAALPERIRAGLRPADLLAATCVAGAREVRPRPHGILHCVMMVESSFRLADGATPREAWLAALWNLDDFKRAQERDDGYAPLAPAGAVDAPRAKPKLDELTAALTAHDAERADAALVALAPEVDPRACFEALWPFAARCYAFLGHKAIYAAQLERTLARIGWQHARDPLRSLVASSLVNRDEDDHDASVELARRIPRRWLAGRRDPAATPGLLAGLRTASPAEARALALAALEDGLAPEPLWDALRLAGAEVFLRRSGRRASDGRLALLPVHAVTVVEALGYIGRRAASEDTRRLVLLQACGWLARLRADLVGMVDVADYRDATGAGGPTLAGLGGSAEPPATLDEALAQGSPDAARSFLERDPAHLGAWTAALRSNLLRTAQEHHQHKYAAALLEETTRCAAPWRPRLLAASADYLLHPGDGATEVHRRSLDVLDRAGL